MKDNYTIQQEIYQNLGYTSQPFPYTTATFLEGRARLLGLTPPPAKKARILELGASYGGNILTQALHNPKATYVGIELSKDQVKKGKEIIKATKLKNITLHAMDLADIPDDFGTFDYIIAHGLYSWVDDATKDQLLEICSKHLSETGIAYVSYNTYPGRYAMEEVRQLMLFANRHAPDLLQTDKVKRGKYIASLVGAEILNYDNLKQINASFLQALRQTVQKADYFVGHDHLEPHNDPVYFYQFAEHAASHGLHYVCDADLALSFPEHYESSMADRLQQLAPDNRIDREQYMDFIGHTSFRKSLLTKQAVAQPANWMDRLDNFYFTVPRFMEGAEPNPALQDVWQAMYDGKTVFTAKDGLSIAEAAHKVHGGDGDITKLYYESLLRHITLGTVFVYYTKPESVTFTHGKSYVPEQYITFMKAITKEGNRIVLGGTKDNEAVGDIGEEDVQCMEVLREPMSKELLTEKLGKQSYGISQNNEKWKTILDAYVKDVCQRLEILGVIKNK